MTIMTDKSVLRLEIPYFEGVNTIVAPNVSKKQEMTHAENVRSDIIGSVERRKGFARLGDVIAATKNYTIFFFENTTNRGMYRVSSVAAATNIYYLNGSNAWTALTGLGARTLQLGDSTSQFDITNPSGSTFRYTWDTTGTNPLIQNKVRVGTTLVIAAQNFVAGNNGTFVVTATTSTSFDVTNASGVVESNKTIGTGSILVSILNYSVTFAEQKAFLSNGHTYNLQIAADGTTVSDASSATGNLYYSPRAKKINYYRDRLYVANFFKNNVDNPNSVQMSSYPVGIVSLTSGDFDVGSTVIDVTDTKYIHSSDSLDVYRANTYIQTLTVSAKTENTITVTATTSALESSDELWVANTFNGEKVFRWADNTAGGVDVKQYDTFKLSGSQNDGITMLANVGSVLAIANRSNLCFWNNSNILSADMGIGCVSPNGYSKLQGTLWFIHYTGIYSTTGAAPKLMSAKVDRYFKGATKAGLEASCSGVRDLSTFFSLGQVTLYNPDGSIEKVLEDVVLEYNLRQENWYVHTGIKATHFTTFIDTVDVRRLVFASTETNYECFEFLSGESDNSRDVYMRLDTDFITLAKMFEKISYPQEVIIEADRGNGISCFASLDEGPFYELEGQAMKGCTILKVQNPDPSQNKPPRCRRMKLSLRSLSKTLPKIYRVAILYTATNEEENFKPNNNP